MGYSLNILNLNSTYNSFNYVFPNIVKEYNLSYFHKEHLYDWLIANALNSVLNIRYSGKVLKHANDSTCNHVYSDFLVQGESIGYHIEKEIAMQIDQCNLNIFRNEVVKLLVLDSTIIIARGTHAGL